MPDSNFIYQQKLTNLALCDEIIGYFKGHPECRIGSSTSTKHGKTCDPKIKDSMDCPLPTNADLFKKYIEALQVVVDEYIKKFPFCNEYSPWTITEPPIFQHYLPGGGFHKWHTERASCGTYSDRHLVFMTYLNDVTDGGETEFFHQNLKIKPEKGLTVIWPADWTYTHRGITSPTQEKFIVTGWFNYI